LDVFTISVIFRAVTVILGFFLIYSSFNIYKRTEGGSKGWLILSVAFSSLVVWGILDTLLSMFYPSREISMILLIILLPLAALTPISAMLMLRDMRIKMPKWMSLRNYIILAVVFFTVLSIYNFALTPFTDPLSEVLSMIHLFTGIAFLMASPAYYIIYKSIKIRFWLILAIAALLIGIGLGMSTMFSECCGVGASLTDTQTCQDWWEWSYRYTVILPLPCTGWLLPILPYNMVIIFIAGVAAIYAFFRIMKLTGKD